MRRLSKQQNGGAGSQDAFVTKLNPAGSALVYSTYLGGGGNDEGMAVAVDASGSAYVSGITNSSNFPTQNGYQASDQPQTDAFITKLAADGASLLYSSYFGAGLGVLLLVLIFVHLFVNLVAGEGITARVVSMPSESPSGPPGSVKIVEFVLFGQPFTAMTRDVSFRGVGLFQSIPSPRGSALA